MSGIAKDRLAVAAVTAAACAAALLALATGPSRSDIPPPGDLAGIEASSTGAARLHPVLPLPGPRGAEVFCRECHPAAPHRGARVSEVMLNAHAVRLDCLACHRPAGGEPRWLQGPGEGMFASVLPPERLTREALARLRAEVTVSRPCFERGSPCDACHRTDGMGIWARPGAPPARAAELERLDAVFTLDPGEKWYFPQFQ